MPPTKRKREEADGPEPYGGDGYKGYEGEPNWTISVQPSRDGTTQEEKEFPLVQESPFSPALNVRYKVLPAKAWSEMRKYSNFIIFQETYTSREFVWVKIAGVAYSDNTDNQKLGLARIVEVRARDARHVYARVVWLYWPGDLPRVHEPATDRPGLGRRPYHARDHELIASNHMDILEVTTFAGKASVEHWKEGDERDPQDAEFWRQTYDIVTGKLSPLRKHCICGAYYNPDTIMVFCEKNSCNIWLHGDCVVNYATQKEYDRLEGAPEESKNGASPEGLVPRAAGKKETKAGRRKLKEQAFRSQIIMDGDKACGIMVQDLRTGGKDGGLVELPLICPRCESCID